MDLETQLREQIRTIYEDAHRRAAPLIMELVKLESMKPPRMFVIPADLVDNQEIRRLLQDSEEQVLNAGRRLLIPPLGTPAPQPLSPPPGTSATDTAD